MIPRFLPLRIESFSLDDSKGSLVFDLRIPSYKNGISFLFIHKYNEQRVLPHTTSRYEMYLPAVSELRIILTT